MSAPKRRCVSSSKFVVIGESQNSDNSMECNGNQDEPVFNSDNVPCTSNAADKNEKRKQPKKVSTPNSIPSHLSHLTEESYEALLKDPKEKLLIWNRLRHGLNPDCLAPIFVCLSMSELATLCEMSDHFKDVIRDRVISKKIFEFSCVKQTWTTDQFFQNFGKQMRKIEVGFFAEITFSELLMFITDYCEPDRLTDIDVHFNGNDIPSELLKKALPYFTNLRRLTMKNIGPRPEDSYKFLTTLPKLKELNINGEFDISPVIKAIANASPNLEIFHDTFFRNIYGIEPQIEQALIERYDGIKNMKSLRDLSVTCFTRCGSDLHYVLMNLPKTVEKLTVFTKHKRAKQPSSPQKYENLLKPEKNQWLRAENLKSLAMISRREIVIGSEETIDFQYILSGLAYSPNIKKFILEFVGIKDIYKVFESAPNLKVVDISRIGMRFLPVEMSQIVRTIRNNRLAQGLSNDETGKPSIHLILSQLQANEILMDKDIRSMVTFQICS